MVEGKGIGARSPFDVTHRPWVTSPPHTTNPFRHLGLPTQWPRFGSRRETEAGEGMPGGLLRV